MIIPVAVLLITTLIVGYNWKRWVIPVAPMIDQSGLGAPSATPNAQPITAGLDPHIKCSIYGKHLMYTATQFV